MDIHLATHALFLDIDGTLIDIAMLPNGVVIPSGLAELVSAATLRAHGALAILTGRQIAEVDRFLAPLEPIAAGVHGAEIRHSPGGAVERKAEAIDADIVEALHALARQEPGVIVELKSASVAVHYRLAEAAEPRIEATLQRILDDGPGHLILSRGRKVLEIVPMQVSKGAALESLMRLPQFRGRRPVMIGDDVSDMSAFEAAARLGGIGLKVAGEQFGAADADFANPAAVRRWIAERAGLSG